MAEEIIITDSEPEDVSATVKKTEESEVISAEKECASCVASEENSLENEFLNQNEETAAGTETSEAEKEQKPSEHEISEDEKEETSTEGSVVCGNITCEDIEKLISGSLAPVLGKLNEIENHIGVVESRVSQLRKLADMHETVENDLNRQINQYKDNFYKRIISPVLMEIIELQEEMCQDINADGEEKNSLIVGYIDSITGFLSHYGVTVLFVKEGDAYDPSIHKPLKAIETDDIKLDKTIALAKQRTIHFVDGLIISRAAVFVYQYKDSGKKNSEEDTANEEV